MQKISKQNKVYTLLVFLISPVVGLWLSFKNYNNSFSKNILWAFCIFYGYTLVISNPDLDANRLRDFFIEYTRYDSYSFSNLLSTFYAADSWNTDVLSEFLRWLVSRFTDNYHIYFAVLGLVYGYFYSRNVFYLLDVTKSKINNDALIFIIMFGLVVGVWELNIFRFFTAAHVFFFGAIRFLLLGKKKFILLSALSLFVHFSFLLPICLLILYSIIGNRPKLYYLFFVISFLISEINIEYLRTIEIPYLPHVYVKKILGYTSDVYVETIEGINSLDKNWYVVAREIAIKLVVLVTLSFALLKNYASIKESKLQSFLCFTLLIVGTSNMISNVPSLDRFLSVSYLFIFGFLFFFFQNCVTDWFPRIRNLVIAALFLYAIVEIRVGFDTIGIRTISSPILTLLLKEDIALINIFKE